MQISPELLRKVAGARHVTANMTSVTSSFNEYGGIFQITTPPRVASYVSQIAHESGGFRYDREVWGPTPAQKRYDTRTDLGNTPARDGDGEKFKGHTPIQITGRANTRAFRDWCRKYIDADCPDFEQHPELMNTDPWEGLGPIWYWSTRNLNRYADEGDQEMITRRINGGLNGYQDRLRYYTRTALLFLAYEAGDVQGFQRDHGLTVDGIAGPRTRSTLHRALVDLGKIAARPVAPPSADVGIPVIDAAPARADKRGFWASVLRLFGLA